MLLVRAPPHIAALNAMLNTSATLGRDISIGWQEVSIRAAFLSESSSVTCVSDLEALRSSIWGFFGVWGPWARNPSGLCLWPPVWSAALADRTDRAGAGAAELWRPLGASSRVPARVAVSRGTRAAWLRGGGGQANDLPLPGRGGGGRAGVACVVFRRAFDIFNRPQ
eukprot:82414-Prymnesium_polylepis.1